MQGIIIKFLATMASFYVTRALIAGFQLDNTLSAYLTASLVLLLFQLLVAPLIKLLLLPVNLLTLGLFRWVTSILVLYLFDLFYGGVNILAYRFPGFNSALISLPPADLNLFWVLLLSSLIMSLTYGIVTRLFIQE